MVQKTTDFRPLYVPGKCEDLFALLVCPPHSSSSSRGSSRNSQLHGPGHSKALQLLRMCQKSDSSGTVLLQKMFKHFQAIVAITTRECEFYKAVGLGRVAYGNRGDITFYPL